MEIKVELSDNYEIKRKMEERLNAELGKLVEAKLKELDVEGIIIRRINQLVANSKYLTDNVIRNLVQQKIARELTDLITKTAENENISN